jgi:hypothetical protein
MRAFQRPGISFTSGTIKPGYRHLIWSPIQWPVQTPCAQCLVETWQPVGNHDCATM